MPKWIRYDKAYKQSQMQSFWPAYEDLEGKADKSLVGIFL